VKVRARSGYFAPDDRRLTAHATTTGATRNEAHQRADMGSALEALAPLAGIPVRLCADFVSRDGTNGEVVVNASVDVSALPFARRDDRRLATVDVAAVVLDDGGGVVATLETVRRSLDLSEADMMKLAQRGLAYTQAVALKPGRYEVRLAARDDASGLVGSAWRRIEVPDLTAGRLALSGLFLLRDADEAHPAAPGATPTLQGVQDLRRFGRAEHLYVQFQVYNAKREAAGASDLVYQAAVLRSGAVVAAAAPEPMAAGAAGPVEHLSRIRLRPFEPGDYELHVTVTDRKATATAEQSVAFTVD
jgi:hypothetical protein